LGCRHNLVQRFDGELFAVILDDGRTADCVLELANRRGAMTLEEIGDIFGVSRERIRQIENSAIKKLKRRRGVDPLLADWKEARCV
jgi:hypothetical protein